MNDDRMPLGSSLAVTWELSEDQRMARMHLPPLQLAGMRKPISIYLDMNAEEVDAPAATSRRDPDEDNAGTEAELSFVTSLELQWYARVRSMAADFAASYGSFLRGRACSI